MALEYLYQMNGDKEFDAENLYGKKTDTLKLHIDGDGSPSKLLFIAFDKRYLANGFYHTKNDTHFISK